jgi:hypothetical protein
MAEKPQNVEISWSIEELGQVDLKDKRLNFRCQDLAETLGQQPTAPINQACEDWADSKAAYRFMDNQRVTPARILAPHSERTLERMLGHKVVLALQDTTFLNYTHHPETQDLGEIGTKSQNQRGFGLHSTLAVTPGGQPLGILSQAFLERPLGKPAHTPSEARKQPIEEKESYRWVQAFEKTIALSPAGVQVVTVCDREADIYEMFVMAKERQASLLVRAADDRCLQDDEPEHLWSKAEQQPVQGELSVEITGNDRRKERQATVTLRVCTVNLRPPWRPEQKKLPVVRLQAILVREENPPENLATLGDHEPIEWLLLTNTTANNVQQAAQVVSWYCVHAKGVRERSLR